VRTCALGSRWLLPRPICIAFHVSCLCLAPVKVFPSSFLVRLSYLRALQIVLRAFDLTLVPPVHDLISSRSTFSSAPTAPNPRFNVLLSPKMSPCHDPRSQSPLSVLYTLPCRCMIVSLTLVSRLRRRETFPFVSGIQCTILLTLRRLTGFGNALPGRMEWADSEQ